MKRIALLAIAATLGIPALGAPLTAGEENSPKEILEQFWKLEIQGAWSTPEGWNQMAALLVHPSPPPRNITIAVIKGGIHDYRVGDPTITNDRAEIYVGFLDPGKLDSALRFIPESQRASNGALIGPSSDSYELVLTDKHWELGADGRLSKQVTGAPVWRIAGRPWELHLTVEAAIRYVAQMRDKAIDPAVEKNGDATITILKRLQ